MRRRLVLLLSAATSMVAVAFLVPLGLLVRETAEDSAVSRARADISTVVPAIASNGSRELVEATVASTQAGGAGHMSVLDSRGWVVGPDFEVSAAIKAAMRSAGSTQAEVPGGLEVVSAVSVGSGTSVVRVFVPDELRYAGQARAWVVLLAVGLVLIAVVVVVADRHALTIVRPTQELAAAARQLGRGEDPPKVVPSGPRELGELAEAFNGLERHVSTLRETEREAIADLAHRLRTPLTKLRLRIEQVPDTDLSDQLRHDVDDVTAEVNSVIIEARGHLGRESNVDAVAVVAERVEFWGALAEDQGRPWDFDTTSGELLVEVGESELRAAVDVLLENVFSHTPEGTAVFVAVSRVEKMVAIDVNDDGPGFDPTSLMRGVSEAGSTGLGLDIAWRLAAEAGGWLAHEAGDDGGTFLRLCLPEAGAHR